MGQPGPPAEQSCSLVEEVGGWFWEQAAAVCSGSGAQPELRHYSWEAVVVEA